MCQCASARSVFGGEDEPVVQRLHRPRALSQNSFESRKLGRACFENLVGHVPVHAFGAGRRRQRSHVTIYIDIFGHELAHIHAEAQRQAENNRILAEASARLPSIPDELRRLHQAISPTAVILDVSQHYRDAQDAIARQAAASHEQTRPPPSSRGRRAPSSQE